MWAPGGPPGPARWDRGRVGARLRAALAGLHELQGLRARQQARVRGALALQPPPAPAAPRGPRVREQRLEAALAALQEQLNQLRLQDVGLKTHLDQLDQRISELQLDVCGARPGAPDSDSRPSSGFYELSDGGSCSLSTSCASVCSDHLSSSLGALLPATPHPRTSAGDCRPWSADETTVCGAPVPSGELWATEEGSGWRRQAVSRPRPVSTGDLDRVLPAGAGPQSASADPKATSFPPHGLDPTYRRDLVSGGGREVYPYPSPLHAVALQSPLFALTKETPKSDGQAPPSKSLPNPSGPSPTRTGPVPEAGPAGAYIDRLLRRHGRGGPPRGSAGEQRPSGWEAAPAQGTESDGHPKKLMCGPGADVGGVALRRGPGRDSLTGQASAPLAGAPHPSRLPGQAACAPVGCACVGAAAGPPPAPDGQDGSARRLPARWGPAPAPGRCAHPHPAAGTASPARPKAGPAGTKAVRDGWGPGDKAPRRGRQPHWGALLAPRLPPAWGVGSGRPPALAWEGPGRSCSESSLYPVSFLVPLLLPPEAAPPGEAGGGARGQQRGWQSALEISARARPAAAQGPGLGPPRPAARRGAGPRPACPRARPRPPRQPDLARSEPGGSGRLASLPHSALGETSEDEASDYTTDRFGDGESSGSDGEARVGGGGGRPARPRARPLQPAPAPAGARPALPPKPRLCRVKASRALRRKMRRFQPGALKVMTTV